MTKKPIVLVILDGWGHSENTDGNAIHHANTPFWDQVWKNETRSLISGSGHHVGLPPGQMGNSEVGHLNIGAGRVVPQDFTRIQTAIDNGEFENNDTISNALLDAKKNNKAVHILGLLSPGGVHSHEEHLHAMIKLAAKKDVEKIYVHAFLDGRDTPPRSAFASIEKMEAVFSNCGKGKIVSLIGRYYAMDRDKRWERVKEAYDLIALGQSNFSANTASAGLEMAYARDESDEFVKATSIHNEGEPATVINEGDTVIFMNYRADRAREITDALTNPNFKGFERPKKPNIEHFITLTQYDEGFPLPSAYPPLSFKNVLGEVLANQNLHQLRIAETEKYAHVTFFFNGGVETPFKNEDRVLIPSPKVATYDMQPEMSAPELTDKLVQAIEETKYDVIICNYANPDMVGHTGDFEAAVKACQVIDNCLARIDSALKAVGGEMLITADHGNVEQMHNAHTGQAHTAHTSEPVPLVYIGRQAEMTTEDGKLSDIAPTILALLGLPIPTEMTGKSLLKIL